MLTLPAQNSSIVSVFPFVSVLGFARFSSFRQSSLEWDETWHPWADWKFAIRQSFLCYREPSLASVITEESKNHTYFVHTDLARQTVTEHHILPMLCLPVLSLRILYIVYIHIFIFIIICGSSHRSCIILFVFQQRILFVYRRAASIAPPVSSSVHFSMLRDSSVEYRHY